MRLPGVQRRNDLLVQEVAHRAVQQPLARLERAKPGAETPAELRHQTGTRAAQQPVLMRELFCSMVSSQRPRGDAEKPEGTAAKRPRTGA